MEHSKIIVEIFKSALLAEIVLGQIINLYFVSPKDKEGVNKRGNFANTVIDVLSFENKIKIFEKLRLLNYGEEISKNVPESLKIKGVEFNEKLLKENIKDIRWIKGLRNEVAHNFNAHIEDFGISYKSDDIIFDKEFYDEFKERALRVDNFLLGIANALCKIDKWK